MINTTKIVIEWAKVSYPICTTNGRLYGSALGHNKLKNN